MKEKAHKSLAELTSAFTSPETTPPSAPPLHKHTLRGICLDPSITYVLVPPEHEISESIDLPSPTDTPNQNQWWSICWQLRQGWGTDTSQPPYDVKKVIEQEVLEATRYTGDGKVLLVYANEKAMISQDYKLPTPLKVSIHLDPGPFCCRTLSNIPRIEPLELCRERQSSLRTRTRLLHR